MKNKSLIFLFAILSVIGCRERIVKQQGLPGLWTLIDADSLTGDRLRGISQNVDLNEEWTFSEGVLKEYFDAQDTIWISGDTFYLNDLSHWVVLAPYKQTLSFDGSNLDISGGNSVDLSSLSGSGSGNQSATFVIAPTGTTADYNTDGTADEVQVEAAIAALPAEGGSILLREGEYNFSSAVDIPSTKKIKIYGVGGGTVVKPAAGIRAFDNNNTTQVGYGQQEEFIISDMRIEGSTSNSVGIYLEDKHLSLIKNIVFVGDSLTAIQLKKTNNIKITGCFFNRCQKGVYGLSGASTGDDIEDVAIVGNDFSYVGRSAIHLESSSEVLQREISRISIVGNNIEEADFDKLYKFAIYLKNSRGSTIVGNTITQTYRGGAIELEGGRLNIISSNVFRENGNNQTGSDSTSTIMLRGSDKNVVIGNTLSDEETDYGFTWISADSNQFLGNITELDSTDTYRELGTSSLNYVWSPGGGGGSGFDPSANIAFTGGNSFAGISTFNGANTYNNTELHTGINTFNSDVVLQKNASTGDAFTIKQDNVAGSYFVLQSGGGGATGVKTYAHGGTVASPTATSNNQFIWLASGRGYDGSTLTSSARGWHGIRSGGTWSGSSTPTYQQFATTPTSSTTAVVRMEISTDGRVAIGSSTPTASAALDIQGTTGGLLLPRLTTAQRDALTASNGLVIYNTTTGNFEGYNGSWVALN